MRTFGWWVLLIASAGLYRFWFWCWRKFGGPFPVRLKVVSLIGTAAYEWLAKCSPYDAEWGFERLGMGLKERALH